MAELGFEPRQFASGVCASQLLFSVHYDETQMVILALPPILPSALHGELSPQFFSWLPLGKNITELLGAGVCEATQVNMLHILHSA